MGAKKRLLIGFLSLGLVAIVMVTSIAVVLSALNANVNSGFSISYTAKNINAAVAGSYNNSGTEKNMTISGQEGLLTFNGDQSDGGGILTL